MNKYAAGFSALAFLLSAAPCHAQQATRTWVSGVGDDGNPCSRTAPCKTFAGAIAKTAAGGEISTLDPAGFGIVTIAKSISITNDNSGEAGILAGGTTGVIINGAGIIVQLRGLVIDGTTPTQAGLHGVRFFSGAALHIQNSVIRNFTADTAGNGVLFAPGASAKLTITDTHFANNGAGAAGGAVVIKPTGGFSSVTLTRVTMDNNSNGLVIDTPVAFGGGVLATVVDSSASANQNTGFALVGNSGATQSFLALDRVVSANNVNGIGSSGSSANVLLGNSVVTGNTFGLLTSGGGKIVSFLNNMLLGNTSAGTPTSTQAGQ